MGFWADRSELPVQAKTTASNCPPPKRVDQLSSPSSRIEMPAGAQDWFSSCHSLSRRAVFLWSSLNSTFWPPLAYTPFCSVYPAASRVDLALAMSTLSYRPPLLSL